MVSDQELKQYNKTLGTLGMGLSVPEEELEQAKNIERRVKREDKVTDWAFYLGVVFVVLVVLAVLKWSFATLF